MRFYSANPPSWWPYRVEAPSSGMRRVKDKYVFLDNGMFRMYLKGERPSLDVWLKHLVRAADRAHRIGAAEVMVVAPDWFMDPAFTIRAASEARRILRDYVLVGVCHFTLNKAAYMTAEELSSLVDVLAVPLKLVCPYSSKAKRRIPRPHRQIALIEQVKMVAAEHGLKVHGLGLSLVTELVKKVDGKLNSFDSTAWTRPHNTKLVKLGILDKRKSCSSIHRELYFALAVKHLADNGVKIEGADIVENILKNLLE